jgi:hypothetical protein
MIRVLAWILGDNRRFTVYLDEGCFRNIVVKWQHIIILVNG